MVQIKIYCYKIRTVDLLSTVFVLINRIDYIVPVDNTNVMW